MNQRVPPHSLEAERAVLASVLLDPGCVHEVIAELDAEDFYSPQHACIYEALQHLATKATPPDLVTLTDELVARGDLEKAGGAAKVSALVDSEASAAHVGAHLRKVRQLSALRGLIRFGRELADGGYDAVGDVPTFVHEAERKLLEVTGRKRGSSVQHVRTAVQEMLEQLDLACTDGGITGLPTGYAQLDDRLGGLQKTDLVILAARPSMGKTALALGIAEHAALNLGKSVLVFSLEMSSSQLTKRWLSSRSRVDAWRYNRGMMDQQHWDATMRAADELSSACIHVEPAPAISPLDMAAVARRIHRERPLDLVVVDYIQLMRMRPSPPSREREVSEISASLKALAKELDVPVLALSQLNRKCEERPKKRPMLSDLRESGSIEQDADVVMLLYRDEFYYPDTSEKKGIAEVIVAKHRNGACGSVDLAFIGAQTRFANLAPANDPPPWGDGQEAYA